MSMLRPETIEQAADLVRAQADAGHMLYARGGGTKLGWSGLGLQQGSAADNGPAVALDTRALNRIVEHNAGDFTAVLEAGVSLAGAQATFARSGQMLALDPPLGADDAATIGGILASNDSGPLRHRYGAMRDLAIGITVVLGDGTVASSGGRVIKNVAGYDLAKLYTGSFGTLGLIARVAVRLHPLPVMRATVVARSARTAPLAAAAAALMRQPLEAECLDVNWSNGAGALLARFAGETAERRARQLAEQLKKLDATEIHLEDEALWLHQRNQQRADAGLVLKVSGRPTDLPALLQAVAGLNASLVSRAALGLSWIRLANAADVAALRQTLAARACTVLDGAARIPDPWPRIEGGALTLMQRVKSRFDPHNVFGSAAFAGGL